MDKLNMKQLSFWIPEDLHQEIKIKAAERNMHLKDWIAQTILERIVREKQYE